MRQTDFLPPGPSAMSSCLGFTQIEILQIVNQNNPLLFHIASVEYCPDENLLEKVGNLVLYHIRM